MRSDRKEAKMASRSDDGKDTVHSMHDDDDGSEVDYDDHHFYDAEGDLGEELMNKMNIYVRVDDAWGA